MTTSALPSTLDRALHALLGERGYLTTPEDCAPYCRDWRGLYQGQTPAVLRPATTAELSNAVSACYQHGVALVPQGGNTGMAGGATPSPDASQVVVSTTRLNRVRDVDPIDRVLEVEAGVPLTVAQQAAAAAGCLLPLSIASEGTAQIGGVLATNAGGNHTLRYGNARDLVLGLEVVLADGSVWNGLRRLRKDNTGYRLSQLFVGSEGTLGIITAATLKLESHPKVREVALVGTASVDAAVRLCDAFRRYDAAALQAFEYMSNAGLEMVLKHIPGTARPLENRCDHYALIELATSRDDADLRLAMEHVLGHAMDAGWIEDAVIAHSDTQRAALWKLREEHSEAQRLAGASVKNDVSVPISKIPAFIERATDACRRLVPGVRVAPFGHLGDGNIHFNLVQEEQASGAAFMARSAELMSAVTRIAMELGGSFSAEHGIGQLKTDLLSVWRGGIELQAMRTIKHALDPFNRLNPGKLLPAP